jgi:acetyl coenzyme A synthetase (ADP forming)-like protein
MGAVVADPVAGTSVRALLEPKSVAIVGASRDASSLGRRVLDALVGNGFRGSIFPVNAHADELAGRRCYRSVRDLPRGIDLGVVAVPRDAVPGVVDECIDAGVRSLVIISAGFAETGVAGRALQNQIVSKARAAGVRMVGPNCMGLMNTSLGLNASFSPVFPPDGPVALSSQSGALGLTLIELAANRGIGLSSFVSVGNKADVSSNDLLEYWESDARTSVILLYLESFGNPRKFGELARRIGRRKPIVAVKAGRTRAGVRAASSHTAALAATDAVVDALFASTGVIRADTIDEMFDIAAILAAEPLPAGQRVGVVTNAGGPGILAVDACSRSNLSVVEFSKATRDRLAGFLAASASLANPVDMVASATPEDYRRAIEAVAMAEEVDALILIYTAIDPAQSAPVIDGIRAGIAAARAAGCQKPVLACLMADPARPVPLTVGAERVPTYVFPENAVRALAKAVRYAEWRGAAPGSLKRFDDMLTDDAKRLCESVVATRGESWLTANEMERLLTAYRLPLVLGVLTREPDEAAAVAAAIGYPVVAKLSARDLVHKTDMGGVVTSLRTAAEVRDAVSKLLATAVAHRIHADGVLIQPMVTDAVETIVGLAHDSLFGPVLGFGLGGTDVELERDVHFRVVPLTDRDANDLIQHSRALPRLTGYRGRPAADLAALSDILLRLSQLAQDLPEVREIDFNPVMALPRGRGCAIVDARVRVAPPPVAAPAQEPARARAAT